MDDIINQRQSQQEAPTPPKRRNWLLIAFLFLFVMPAVLLLLLGGVGFGVFLWIVNDTRSQPPYSAALELIQKDAQLIEHLGEPIRDLRWLPTDGYPKQFQMQVEGPKGLADISVTAGEFDGKWELTAVDVFVREGSKRFSLEMESGSGDAPTWGGGAATASESTGELGLDPPAGINIQLPGGGPPGVEISLPESPPDMNIQMPHVPPAPES